MLKQNLIEQLHQACSVNIPINGTILRDKAMEISFRLDITGFSASNGQINRFKKKTHSLAYKSVCGESVSIDQATVDD